MIITKIFECDNRIIQKQFTRCISTIARLDYPEKWPTLLSNDILSYLNSQNEKGIYTGLLALHALVQKYEFCLKKSLKQKMLIIGVENFKLKILSRNLDRLMDGIRKIDRQKYRHTDRQIDRQIDN